MEVGGVSLYVLHNLDKLSLNPAVSGFSAVIYGHTHKPHVARRDDVLYVNPGAAGPRRFRLPISVAKLRVRNGSIEPELIEIPPSP